MSTSTFPSFDLLSRSGLEVDHLAHVGGHSHVVRLDPEQRPLAPCHLSINPAPGLEAELDGLSQLLEQGRGVPLLHKVLTLLYFLP